MARKRRGGRGNMTLGVTLGIILIVLYTKAHGG